MTLIVALKGKISKDSKTDAIVVVSDTQVTSDIKEPMKKVFQLNDLPIFVGGAGSVSLSRHVVFSLEKLFLASKQKLGREMSCQDFDTIVNSDVEERLREIYASHSRVIKKIGLSLILGFSDATKVRLYEVQNDGVPMRMDDNPGYCCIGIGYSTGGRLLIQQFYSSDFLLLQLLLLASYMIAQVSNVDPSVGCVTTTKFCFGGKVIKPKEELLQKRLKLRTENMKKVWNLLANGDFEFERRFNEVLDKTEFCDIINSI